MKIYKYITLSLIAALPLSSCNKFLDTQPVNYVKDDNTIFDLTSAQSALRGVYRQLGSTGYYGETYVTLGYFPSGDVKNLTTGGAANLVTVNFRADDVNFNTAWTAIYYTINRANNVITKVPSLVGPAFTQAQNDQIVGEAKFIRALAYFDIARAWGGAQIVLAPTTSIDALPNVKRSTTEQTYAQVEQDLNDAEALLPNTLNRIRTTKRTVWALKARLYLYRKDWAKAEEYATKLIESTDYELLKPFSSWFANDVVGTRESIFELEYSAANPSTIRQQMQHSTNGGTYRYAPTDKFVQLLNDPAVSGGRSALIGKVTQAGTTLWFGNLYYRKNSTDPAYVLRIAEQYLIRAEARAHLGKVEGTDGGLADLNKVRERAEVAALPLTTADDLLLAIENERRVEFAWEAHRWFDLARTGRAKTVLEAIDPNIKVDANENVFPIPVTQIQLDKNLEQNPGY
ncbi:RagB/SusD family nutrient uptake outer membrane protein [Mucilaginibacter limnophilus]|uniref:RagB/SusD family nutrient uptake outer membrane protein n=1 Tax=Mucilaginibacter limnophilus TaxID=1932778 RepID=A0A437MTR2_9SPHI|nr:RagB/SusD family nutrient uptake outer membrane protein [Mucilaginibacter limnophilus]RVU01046.1 RagB/SusD family nutrient uptake outer membrane protein [Mucilaginibacter limnophilus]